MYDDINGKSITKSKKQLYAYVPQYSDKSNSYPVFLSLSRSFYVFKI